MLPLLLIILLSLFVVFAVKVMISRGHDLHAFAFFILYVYTVFAQIGYAYFPELSIFIGAYFGPDLFYKYWVFMFLSFFFSYLIYKKFNKINSIKCYYRVKSSKNNSGILLFLFLTISLLIVLFLYFKNNRALFGWGGGSPMGSPWFVIGFRIFTIITFFNYVFVRQKLNKIYFRILFTILFLIYFSFFISVTVAAGNRSDILYFFIAVSFYELSPIGESLKYQKRKVFTLLLTGFFLVNFLMVILALRSQTSELSISKIVNYQNNETKDNDVSLPTKILLQDYYSPSHPLFISMQYKFVDPLETIKSNIANSLVLFKYPFLTQTIVSKVDSNIERGGGWSFHLFVEGYNALGMLGFFYNGIFWNLGLGFWLILSKSNNSEHNKIMSAIVIFLIVNTMRGQTCSFVQSFWMTLLPSIGLLLLMTNSKIKFIKHGKSS
jgi:hypothetical protein